MAEEIARLGDELIIDVEHYRRHPKGDRLWCVVYDAQHLISNPAVMISDLEGRRTIADGEVTVRVFIVTGAIGL